MSRLASRCAPAGAEDGAPWIAHRSSGARAALPALTALVSVAICLVFTFVMMEWHSDVGRVIGSSAESLTAAVAGDVDRNIEFLDFLLKGVVDEWQTSDAERPTNTTLLDNAVRAPGFGMILVLDRDGKLIGRSPDLGRLEDDFSDRDYFRVHVGTSNVGLYVSRPFRSRMTATWVVALSRRIDDSKGDFAGVVTGTIDIAYLHRLYAGLAVGSDDAVTLFRTDGTVITREPFVQSDVRLWAGGGDTFNHMRASRAGTFEGESPVDGRRRIISYHRVGRLPLIQAVEVSGAGDYADWWRRATAVAGLLTLLCLGVMGLSLVLYRELGRRSVAEAELSRLAGTDPLTGLANRRRFEVALADEWCRALDADQPLTLLMIDADSFKSYNDLFGHPAGDAVLQAVAGQLDIGARGRGGLACRCGGEEFVVLIPGCDENRALDVAEALRAGVESLALPHPIGIGGRVTISIGVATACPSGGGTARDLLAAADAALYRAKAEGRNRCRAGSAAALRAA